MDIRHTETLSSPTWPEDSVARVPYWVYQHPANYALQTPADPEWYAANSATVLNQYLEAIS